jgi:hypothetical protein
MQHFLTSFLVSLRPLFNTGMVHFSSQVFSTKREEKFGWNGKVVVSLPSAFEKRECSLKN